MAKTLKDIAQELNMSASTVSRVINNKSNVNAETRNRVLNALENINYVPNQVARSLKKSATKTIGIIVPDVCEVFFGQVIRGIDRVVSQHGYSIILADSNENKTKEEGYLDILFQQRVDALVIATVNGNSVKILNYFENEIPIVFIDNLPNINTPFDAVLIDNVLAGKMAVKHLIEAGHEHIAVIAGVEGETTGTDRLTGYIAALCEAGIKIDERLIMHGNFKEDSGSECMDKLLQNRNGSPFSAVCIMSEMMTVGAIKSIRRHSLRIPDDVALVGFDIHDRFELIEPGITSVRQPEEQIGEITGEMLIKRLLEKRQGKKAYHPGQKMLLTPYLEVHQSSGVNLNRI